ncbi:MAG: flavodoxin family protein [Candidatus Omnitrophota bacterium]
MKALGILAGPRKGRATDMVIDAVLAGLKDRGAETEKISLYDFDIKPCTGCCTCEKTGKCVIEDDQHIILDKMDASDVIVFGSPVYWSNVTSEAKKLFDRAAGFFKMTNLGPKRTKDKPGKVVLVASCGAPFPFTHIMGVIPGCMHAMKVFFGRMKVKIKTIYAAGMLDPKTSKPSEKLLKKAYRLGKTI